MKYLTLGFILILTQSCFYEEDVPVDQEVWQYEFPENVGLSRDDLLRLNTEIDLRLYESISGLIIIKDDQLVFENYYANKNRQTLVPLGQVSIVFSWAALGIAINEGLVELTDPIHQYLPEYATIFENDTLKKLITLENIFLSNASIAWNEFILRIYENPKNDLNIMKTQQDWVRFILEKPLDATPGSRTNRSSAGGLLIAKIIESVTGEKYDVFLRKRLFVPLGIKNYAIESDSTGNQNGGTGLSLTLIDLTKFAYLVLNNGIWQNRTIINPNLIAKSSEPILEISQTRSLGYLWRLFNESSAFGKVVYFADEFGQHIYILPELNMIVAISAENFLRSSPSVFGTRSFMVFREVFKSASPQ